MIVLLPVFLGQNHDHWMSAASQDLSHWSDWMYVANHEEFFFLEIEWMFKNGVNWLNRHHDQCEICQNKQYSYCLSQTHSD